MSFKENVQRNLRKKERTCDQRDGYANGFAFGKMCTIYFASLPPSELPMPFSMNLHGADRLTLGWYCSWARTAVLLAEAEDEPSLVGVKRRMSSKRTSAGAAATQTLDFTPPQGHSQADNLQHASDTDETEATEHENDEHGEMSAGGRRHGAAARSQKTPIKGRRRMSVAKQLSRAGDDAGDIDTPTR